MTEHSTVMMKFNEINQCFFYMAEHSTVIVKFNEKNQCFFLYDRTFNCYDEI